MEKINYKAMYEAAMHENDKLKADYYDLLVSREKLREENERLNEELLECLIEDECPVFDASDLLEMELESATDEIERLKKAVAELKTELDEAKCLVVDINDELRDAHNANECLRAENVKLNKRIVNLEADMEGQCLGTKVALELNEEYRAKINELENDLSVQKGIVHVQDDCIDNMMDIFKVVESVCDKWEKAGKMMIKNDHHAIAGIALQKMVADIRAAL